MLLGFEYGTPLKLGMFTSTQFSTSITFPEYGEAFVVLLKFDMADELTVSEVLNIEIARHVDMIFFTFILLKVLLNLINNIVSYK